MSFIDSILDIGSNVAKIFTGNNILSGVARTAGLSFLMNQIQSSINADNSKPSAANTTRPDPGVRVQVSPSTDHAIPIVYGVAYLGGILTDAAMTSDKKTMYYCLTLCEKTGVKLSDNQPSEIFIDAIYWDENRLNFNADGITVISATDAGGNEITDYNGLIKIYCYSGNSSTPINITGYTGTALPNAYSVMPNWTAAHAMNDLVFAIVRIDYSADKKVTQLGDIKFKIRNTMTQPGDCIYDYMTNTRYGGGIDPGDINV